MNCGDMMSRNVEALTESDTVAKAAAVMASSGVGFLPICDGAGRALGVITDRDIAVRAVAKFLPTGVTPARTIMSAPAVTCSTTADVRVAEDLMAEERVSRVLVTDGDGRIVGVLSLADIIEHASGRQALRTARAVLWRDALGPRGGAAPGDALLQDKPIAPEPPRPSGGGDAGHDSVFTGGHWSVDTKEFPG
jgi:CBS domain-containing protein